MKISILGMSEIRWTGAGMIMSDKYKIIYSGRSGHDYGVGIIINEDYASGVHRFWNVSEC